MFAVLHIPDFALQSVLRLERDFSLAGLSNPEPKTQNLEPARSAAAALFAGAGKKSLVLAANSAARAAGVELAMTAPQAVARCPTLLIRTTHPAAEADARAALLAVGFTLSPAIEDTAPGVCTIDLKGADEKKLPATLAAALRQLARLDLPATAGVGATPLLALYAARAAGSIRSNCLRSSRRQEAGNDDAGAPSLLTSAATTESARLAEDPPLIPRLSPADPPILHVTDPASFLAPLPLATADPPPELAGILAHWGLRTLGDLTALPCDEIVRRFGAAGLALWQRAAGGGPRPLRPVIAPQTFSATMEFEEEIETLEPLLFILRRFLERLALELRASQFVAAELELTLRLEDETEHTRRFRLPEPTADVDILFRTLHTHLESLHTDSAIVALALRLTPARPLVRQQGLFETGLRDPHGFAETLARVSALVGADRLGTPQPEDTHRPDAVRLVPPAAVIPPPAAPPLHPAPGLPLRRFRPPLPVKLEFTTGQPTYLWIEYFHGPIAEFQGPWRASGDWWQADRVWQRIEWDIALADGGLYRLLQIGEAWYIEGEYD